MSGVTRTKLIRYFLAFLLVYAAVMTIVVLIYAGAEGIWLSLASWLPLVAGLAFWFKASRRYRHETKTTSKLRRVLEEEQLQSEEVLAALDEGVLIMSKDGIVKHVNARMTEMMASSEDYLVGKHFSRLVSENLTIVSSSASKPRLSYNVVQVFETGEPIHIDHERLLYHQTNRYLDLTISLLPLKNEHGEVSALMIVGRDISDLVRQAEQKDEFLTRASNRLSVRTQSVVSELSEALQAPDLGEAARSKVAAAATAADRLKTLTGDIQTYADLTEHADASELRFVNVAAVFDTAADRATARYPEKFVTITKEPAVASMVVDEHKFQTLVDQLVDNAYKFSPDKDTILVRAVADGTTGVIEITDNGVSISEEQQDTVFEPFVSPEAGAQAGTGLGMTICKKIVDSWGGEIKFSTLEAGGTVVTVTIPGAIQDELAAADQSTPAEPTVAAT